MRRAACCLLIMLLRATNAKVSPLETTATKPVTHRIVAAARVAGGQRGLRQRVQGRSRRCVAAPELKVMLHSKVRCSSSNSNMTTRAMATMPDNLAHARHLPGAFAAGSSLSVSAPSPPRYLEAACTRPAGHLRRRKQAV